MFLGELSCLLVYFLTNARARSKGKAPDTGKEGFNPLILALPATCDLLATSTMYVGLGLTVSDAVARGRGAHAAVWLLPSTTTLVAPALCARSARHARAVPRDPLRAAAGREHFSDAAWQRRRLHRCVPLRPLLSCGAADYIRRRPSPSRAPAAHAPIDQLPPSELTQPRRCRYF